MEAAIKKISASLSKKNRDALGLGENQAANAGEVNGAVDVQCWDLSQPPEPKAPVLQKINPPEIKKPEVKTPEPPAQPAIPLVEYSLNGGLALGMRFPSPNNQYLLPDRVSGVGLLSGASLKINTSKDFSLQADYTYAMAYNHNADPAPVVFNSDYLRLAAVYLSRSVDISGNAGWLRYRADYPRVSTPDFDGLAENVRTNFKITKEVSLNFDQYLMLGATSTAPIEASYGKVQAASLGFEPGLSCRLGALTLFGGGIVAAEPGKTAGGWDAGAGYAWAGHEVNLRGQQVSSPLRFDRGTGVQLRYAYFVNGSGVGAKAGYVRRPEERDVFTAGLFGAIKLSSLLGQAISVAPFADLAEEKMGTDSVNNLSAGIVLRFGSLLPAVAPAAAPYQVQPQPETR